MLKKVILSILLVVFITSCSKNNISQLDTNMLGKVYSYTDERGTHALAIMGEFLFSGDIENHYQEYPTLLIIDNLNHSLNRTLYNVSNDIIVYRTEIVEGDSGYIYYNIEVKGDSLWEWTAYEYDATAGQIEDNNITRYKFNPELTEKYRPDLLNILKMTEEEINAWEKKYLENVPDKYNTWNYD